MLVGAGVILLIGANWEYIPRLMKLTAALALLIGAHVTGWKLAQDDRHPALASAFHFLGSLLFLANIALVGQVYNLSSRPSNAILLWFAGVAPLAWIFRSKAQHVLALLVFTLWFGIELNLDDSWLNFGQDARQFMAFAWVGIIFIGLGAVLRKTTYPEFGPSTELLGLIMLLVCTYPLTIGFYYGHQSLGSHTLYVAGALTAAAVALTLWSAARTRQIPDAQWRWVWTGAVAGIAGLCWMGLLAQEESVWMGREHWSGYHWIGAIVLFVFCLIQIQVGLLRRSAAMVNLAITFIAVHSHHRLHPALRLHERHRAGVSHRRRVPARAGLLPRAKTPRPAQAHALAANRTTTLKCHETEAPHSRHRAAGGVGRRHRGPQ